MPRLCEVNMQCGATKEQCEFNSAYDGIPLCKVVAGDGPFCK
jgi:hypothetical protein